MKPCPEWEEQLIELVTNAFGAETNGAVREHLARCARCTGALDELQSHRERIDAAVQRIVGEAEPPRGFLESVLQSATEVRPKRRHWAWGLAAAAAASLVLWVAWPHPEPDAESLSILAWQSPTAALLRSPAETLLRSAPRLGESYGNLDVALGEQEEGVAR